MYVLRLFAASALSALLWAQTANAETFYPLISYQCDTSANIIRITNSLLPSDTGKDYPYSEADGTYSPWHMVDITVLNGTPKVTDKRNVIKTCKLSSGEYTITLSPQVFSNDLTGRCGESISGAVIIEVNGEEIQERLPFEDYCHGNAPIITQVTVLGETGNVKIKRIPKYKFY